MQHFHHLHNNETEEGNLEVSANRLTHRQLQWSAEQHSRSVLCVFFSFTFSLQGFVIVPSLSDCVLDISGLFGLSYKCENIKITSHLVLWEKFKFLAHLQRPCILE